MSGWTHAMCAQCWNEKYPDREPVKVRDLGEDPERCCFCGKEAASGIYVRADPKSLDCGCEY